MTLGECHVGQLVRLKSGKMATISDIAEFDCTARCEFTELAWFDVADLEPVEHTEREETK